MELLAQGDTVFDILDGRAHEDARKKLLLAQEEPGRGKGGLSWHLTGAAVLLWPFVAVVREPGPALLGVGAPDQLWLVCFPAEVTFVSEMRTSKAFRLQHGGNRAVAVRGRFTALRWPASPSTTAFLALCTPVACLPADGDAGSQDHLFQSTHILDMTFTDVTER